MPLTDSELTANRLALAYKDMHDVLRYLRAYEELAALQASEGTSRYFDHCEGILVAAVVAYCRPFKRSNSEEKADRKLKVSDFTFMQESPELARLHLLLGERRDGAIAHGDWTYHSTELIHRQDPGVLRRFPIPQFVQGIDVALFKQLSEAVAHECAARSFDLDRKTLGRKAP